ncbi:MAG: MaoC family dehydratase N-terminal domain-containing protein [Deltaproteobacteria bacterium]|nr:MaoC family dehydratase N-terminal domain-containing protein [Deltaproteobacteria bacterium]
MVNNASVFHGEEEYECYQQIYPGDVITGTPKVVKIGKKESRSGSQVDTITVEVFYKNQRGENVANDENEDFKITGHFEAVLPNKG